MRLRYFRRIFSTFFFVVFVFVTADAFELLPATVKKTIVYTQIVPSLLGAISGFLIPAVSLIILISVTLLGGRLYCSFLCPLGYMQDGVIWLKGRITKKLRWKFRKPSNRLWYGILILTAALFVLGQAAGVMLLDPYSISGRFIHLFVQPLVFIVNNSISAVLNSYHNFSLTPVKLSYPSLLIYIIPAITLFFVIILSWGAGRRYCNLICPVGAILSIAGKISWYRIRIDETKCNGCGICERSCKAGCINSKEKQVDTGRCVMC
ncbi:MAG: 4Fe-4S binding protein, partial [Ignavibacteria bacterium]|nr:4Fe-4S binding protein [Ignavibacteria bacterium]